MAQLVTKSKANAGKLMPEPEEQRRRQKTNEKHDAADTMNKEGNVLVVDATAEDDTVVAFDLNMNRQQGAANDTQEDPNVNLSGTVKLVGGRGDNHARDILSRKEDPREKPPTIHWKVLTAHEAQAQQTGEKSGGKCKKTAESILTSPSATLEDVSSGMEEEKLDSQNNEVVACPSSTAGLLDSTLVDMQFELTQIIEVEDENVIEAASDDVAAPDKNKDEDMHNVVVVVVGGGGGESSQQTETGNGEVGNNNGDMDKLPIELAQGETLFSLDGIDDTESSGGNSQTCAEKTEDTGQHLEEVKTATGEVIRLKKPRNEEKAVSQSQNIVGVSPHRTDDGSFPCTLCSQRFTRKLFLNNHMEEQHGVKYVFTERGRKVKLVRIPKNYDPQNMEDLDPSIRKLIKKSAGCHDLSKVVGVVTVPDPDEESVTQVTEAIAEDKNGEGEKENEEGVECGFLVDRINTAPYQKALSRGEVPFCAFSPISTTCLYLLRIQDCSDSTRHMLVPASKEDVFSTPGALKRMNEQDTDCDESVSYKVAIVAIARQIYSEEEKQLVVSVDPPLRKDKEKITNVKFLSLDKFADFAFLGFDGNVDEFAKNNESGEKDCITSDQDKSRVPVDTVANPTPSPIPSPLKDKSPPRAPARRGRGGRRRGSRRSPAMPTTSMRNHHQRQDSSLGSSFSLPHTISSQFSLMQEVPYDSYVKMEHSDTQNHPFLTQVAIPEPMVYGQDKMLSLPGPMDFPVPMPVSEVTVSTSEPGMEIIDEQTNHDIITIALDQLLPMTSGDGFNGHGPSERSSRGGRRPGRKPGRKPAKEREVCENDENSLGQRVQLNSDGTVPKRRGRPPKNRVLMQITGPDADNSTVDADEYENIMLGKRMKLHTFE
ncbi:unnamed protein product [Orchesella dallaii]|uniref:C2H2-type domain-containing protein n=1 Tax=Orchesella dallaii TaxID=48710 RepID=A0ABP1RM50_9HEXA